jgi:hypothetical protein
MTTPIQKPDATNVVPSLASLEDFLTWLATKHGEFRFISLSDDWFRVNSPRFMALRIRDGNTTHEVHTDILDTSPGSLRRALEMMQNRLERQLDLHK